MAEIEVVYEDGVFRPLRHIDIEEGRTMTIYVEEGDQTKGQAFLALLDTLPQSQVDFERLDRRAAEGRVTDD